MNLEEASKVAIEVSSIPGVVVLAIGRFVPVEELEPQMPFKVAVFIEGHDRPRMIYAAEDVLSLLPKPKPVEPPAAAPKRRPVETTPMLF